MRSSMADNLVTGKAYLALAALMSLLASLGGAMTSAKLGLLAKLISSFFIGGLVGAIGFKEIGYITTMPLAVLLLLLV